jgi:hypothetical protein
VQSKNKKNGTINFYICPSKHSGNCHLHGLNGNLRSSIKNAKVLETTSLRTWGVWMKIVASNAVWGIGAQK